jgi:hypothetical protein
MNLLLALIALVQQEFMKILSIDSLWSPGNRNLLQNKGKRLRIHLKICSLSSLCKDPKQSKLRKGQKRNAKSSKQLTKIPLLSYNS